MKCQNMIVFANKKRGKNGNEFSFDCEKKKENEDEEVEKQNIEHRLQKNTNETVYEAKSAKKIVCKRTRFATGI